MQVDLDLPFPQNKVMASNGKRGVGQTELRVSTSVCHTLQALLVVDLANWYDFYHGTTSIIHTDFLFVLEFNAILTALPGWLSGEPVGLMIWWL